MAKLLSPYSIALLKLNRVSLVLIHMGSAYTSIDITMPILMLPVFNGQTELNGELS
jgi:hypothetical protein